MPASKFVNVLAILRKTLSLKQSELAELAGCSVSTIQAIEVNKLKLSGSLAARISVTAGVDMDWLLRNNVNEPMPPLPPMKEPGPLRDYVCTICLLGDVFSRLFAAARRIKTSGARRALELIIAAELDTLKKTPHDPKAEPMNPTSREVFQYFNESMTLDPRLAALLDLDHLIQTAKPQAKLKLEDSTVSAQPERRQRKPSRHPETVSPEPRQAPRRSRQSV